MAYSVQEESKRILASLLSSALPIPASVVSAAQDVTFTGDSQPFIPSPCKMTESSSALSALLAASAAAVAADRYGLHASIQVDTYVHISHGWR